MREIDNKFIINNFPFSHTELLDALNEDMERNHASQ